MKCWRDIKLPCRPSSHLNILIHSLFQPWILSNFARPLMGFESLGLSLAEMATSLHYPVRYDTLGSRPFPSARRDK